MAFPSYLQSDRMVCGPTCLRIIAKHYGRNYSMADVVRLCSTTREGSSMLGLSEAAEKLGFRTLGVKLTYKDLSSDAGLPCIAHWNQNHFVVIYKIKRGTVYISDPAFGLVKYEEQDFLKKWAGQGSEGTVLLLEPTPEFYKNDDSLFGEKKQSPKTFAFLYHYARPHKKAAVQLVMALLATSMLQLIFPFLTQSIFDIGIQNHDYPFIYLILFAQLMVFFGRTSVDILRSFIMTYVSSRINISMASDFFVKLMKLPISYFDTKMTGDIMQRIGDNRRIESFLTGSSFNTLFSLFNFIVFGCVLAFYSVGILTVFLVGSTLYFLWITYFLKYRAELDFKRFRQSGRTQSNVIELINGMQEIKLHNCERQKRWKWEILQVQSFKISLKGLSLNTVQNSGSLFINEIKNIIITFLTAKLVLEGSLTFGTMLSISYITGQLNGPVLSMVGFIQSLQDAKISLERLSEIHNREDEEAPGKEFVTEIESNASFHLKNLSFKYEGAGNAKVLKNLEAVIPNKKITAIVGSSGSGKTTLLKLLLKFYDPSQGGIFIANQDLKKVSPRFWREKFGVVMQEGYIFSDTIANNIAVGVDHIDLKKLEHAAHVANIKEFIDELPNGYNTKIGMEGTGISTGQRQRILIARAVYKNPEYLFFDEATSSLDANNEKVIMENLNEFFKDKTVVIIAHRLSTVKNADQILVLDKGEIIETGNHQELTAKKGAYYSLVKNQLELGK